MVEQVRAGHTTLDLRYYTIHTSPHCSPTLNPHRLDYCDKQSISS